MHVIAGKAVALQLALQDEFRVYQRQVLANAQVLATTLAESGARVVSGGTDNHLMLVDVTPLGVTGKEAEQLLDEIGITVNKNGIPSTNTRPTRRRASAWARRPPRPVASARTRCGPSAGSSSSNPA